MPALSPTMTEGNIATWQVKEGDKFAAGDVLLEIETDKATMDVEAQEDGIMMKIMQGDGSKGVQVGARIAVIAEEGDDISSLEIPADESPKPKESKESSSKPEPSKPEEAQAESSKPAPEMKESGAKTVRKAQKQTYPLLPSVAHLLHEKGIDESKISEMTPTGPNGRLLKGDVLAYLGAIAEKTPADIEARWGKLSHLDLSNIKVAEKKPEAAKPAEKAAEKAAPVVEELLVTLPISLASVIEVQRKVQDTLGVFMPLSTFIARATDVANDELPLAAGAKPSADELFNQVLGLDKVGPKGSRGYYLPQISALPPPPSFGRRALPQKADIIDILAASSKKSAPVSKTTLVPSVSTAGPNVFSLKVTKAEEKRARVFLERVKLVLENEPGRLVL
ncbi:putative pyruvate dehydrogenase protein x component protein [Phaeoacremonium minimum UCRPA7]|uniref:Putative pyruvate dehydrogenase protein x component protein n=1 Tax=Phaeoacremonium minimum (strain UCR-PA7) TaxID=1286976 RepID=R8BYK2_PHAM7|nr:putative pyruvate dehydrogenase protein x component protein [Phaeoacremonium minimum UCRPA7]EOO04427.1 putative pyruvate dehydrogenase protein x component protein [Phaeoacremonium minimum UCRPA7]